jgi:hypothetical protein
MTELLHITDPVLIIDGDKLTAHVRALRTCQARSESWPGSV